MFHQRSARRHGRLRQPVASRHRTAGGQSTAEYLVIAGVVVAIVLGVAMVFRTQIQTAVATLGCRISAGAGGSGGGCGGGAAAGAGGPTAAANTRLAPGQLVQVPGGGGGSSLVGLPNGTAPPTSSGILGKAAGLANVAVNTAGQIWNGAPPYSPGAPTVGGPTVTPGFGTPEGVAAEMARHPGTLATVAKEAGTAVWTVSPVVPSGGTFVPVEINDKWLSPEDAKRIFDLSSSRYGNWVGEGWWGGSELDRTSGLRPPIDALDALGQAHDFGYAYADEMGEIYGEAEKWRLRALADELGYRAWERLPKDPADWVPRPKDLEEARRYQERFPIVMQGMAALHEQKRQQAPPPTAAQLADLEARGPVGHREVYQEAQERITAWKIRVADYESKKASVSAPSK